MTAKLSLTTEEIFEEAEIAYNNCKVIVESLADSCQTIDSDFNKENALVQFDLMLQAILFSQALADGVFSEEEKDFIKKLAQKNNLFDYVIPEEGKTLTMEEAFNLDMESLKAMSDSINASMNTFADDFIVPFAMLDAATTTNVLFDLSTDLSNISVLLSAVDGEITEDELEAFSKYSDELLLGKWKDIKGIAEDILEDAMNELPESDEE